MNMTDYVRAIRDYPHFAHCTDEGSGLFTYSDANAPRLVELREAYSLDAVAGEGGTWSKATRLLNWTFEQLFCVDQNTNLDLGNSLDILAHRRKASLFCIHKAIVLHEALLSIGVPSRLLWCYPYRFDSDRHVVAIVYVPAMAKWVVLDPTFNTYFHDADGAPLSILEVRAMFGEGRSPSFRHITIDKNWTLVVNDVVCETYDQFYQLYMAKNCFRFSSPSDSRFGCSSDDRVGRVFLNPSRFTSIDEYDRGTKNPSLTVYTTSARAFFPAP